MDESEIDLVDFEDEVEMLLIEQLEILAALEEYYENLFPPYQEGEEKETDLEKLFHSEIEEGKLNYVVYYSFSTRD